MDDAQWGSEAHGGDPGKYLLISDCPPLCLRAYEDNARKGDNVENRRKSPLTMAVVIKLTKQQNKLLSAAYGQERREERIESPKFTGDLHYTYGELIIPIFLMHLRGEEVFAYNIIVAESTRRMLQAPPRSARRDRLGVGGSTPSSKRRGRCRGNPNDVPNG